MFASCLLESNIYDISTTLLLSKFDKSKLVKLSQVANIARMVVTFVVLNLATLMFCNLRQPANIYDMSVTLVVSSWSRFSIDTKLLSSLNSSSAEPLIVILPSRLIFVIWLVSTPLMLPAILLGFVTVPL